jgi:hypothetical protein
MSERFQASGKKIYRIKRGALTVVNKATGKAEKVTSRETEQKLNKETEPEIKLENRQKALQTELMTAKKRRYVLRRGEVIKPTRKRRQEYKSSEQSAEKQTQNETTRKNTKRGKSPPKNDTKTEQKKSTTHRPKATSRRRLRFDNNEINYNVGGKVGTAVSAYTHNKIREVEDDNVSVKAAHNGEIAVETGARNKLHFEQKSRRTTLKTEETKTASTKKENTKLRNKKIQKSKIKKDYAKKDCDTQTKAAHANKTAEDTAKAIKNVILTVKNHPVAVIVAIFVVIIIFTFMSFASLFAGLGGGSMGGVVGGTFLADSAEIAAVETAYTGWESELQTEIDNAEDDYPGYDEYVYETDPISHNQTALIAYCTVMYEDFKFADIEADLQTLFNEQYNLTFEESTEERTIGRRTVIVKILTVKLTATPFEELIAGKMTDEQKIWYETLITANT